MGLKDKIKDKLHGDKEEHHSEENTPSQAPGAFPSENNTPQEKTSLGEYGSSSQGAYEPASAGQAPSKHTSTGRMPEEAADYGRSDRRSGGQDPYWGSMSEGQSQQDRNMLRKELPHRPNDQPGTTSSTGGTYNGVAGRGSRDYDSRDRDFGGREFGSSTEYGSGREFGSGREQPPPAMAQGTHESRPYEPGMDRERAGYGAAGAAAGYAASRDSRDRAYDDRSGVPKTSMVDDRQYDHSRTGAPQIPASDPYQSRDPRDVRDPRDARDPRDFEPSRRVGPHDSGMANKMDPRVDSDLDGSRNMPPQQPQGGRGMGMGMGMGTGMAAGAGAGAAASGLNSGTQGPGHYGPAHEGAKVVHQCQNCGVDNDISQYFRKDAVYRMG